MTENAGSGDRAVTRVTLVDCGGQIWLVEGEDHLDALLINELPDHVTVRLVKCETRAEMYALWTEHTPTQGQYAQPWALNPAITNRLLAHLGLSSGAVQFTPWSAMLDEAGRTAVGHAATWLASHPAGTVLLRQWTDAAPGHADLQRLRLQLVTGALAGAGADPARLRTELVASGTAEEAERVEIVTQPG